MYHEQFPEAMNCLGTGPEECLTALRFLETQRKRIRTTNLLERLFGEGQRRCKVIPQFMNEWSGLSLICAVLVDASAAWRGVKIAPAISQEVEVLRTSSKAQETNLIAA
jgi:putative transposase